MALNDVPTPVLDVATKVGKLIGTGLYGVDLKASGVSGAVVTEVNDNPNIDSGCEDGVLGDALYDRIMGHFLAALDERGRRR